MFVTLNEGEVDFFSAGCLFVGVVLGLPDSLRGDPRAGCRAAGVGDFLTGSLASRLGFAGDTDALTGFAISLTVLGFVAFLA